MLLISLEKSLAVSMNQSILRKDHMLTLWPVQGASLNIRNVAFEHRNARSTEAMSLGTRRRDGHSDRINYPIDTIDQCVCEVAFLWPLSFIFWTGLQHF